MTQVFADDDQVGELLDGGRGGGHHLGHAGPGGHAVPGAGGGPGADAGFGGSRDQIPAQVSASRLPPVLGPAMMPGKGVRPIRCVGCSRDTLPRHDDGAPLCQRCSELLASADTGLLASLAWPSLTRTSRSPRWRRRRSPLT